MRETKPIRVLHIVGRMDRGGIETMIMNLYRNIDRTKIQFDFLAHYGREAAYNDEIRCLGGRIYEMPALRDETHVYYWKIAEYTSALNRFFEEHQEYKMIHCHMTNTAAIYMPIAKKHGVKCIIAHSHSSHGKAGLLGVVTNLLQKPIYKNATDWFACSRVAAEWFYPKGALVEGEVTIVPNAVDAKRFRFNSTVRDQMRKDLGVDYKFVVGCVGRLRKEKNQVFLVDVMEELLKVRPNAILVCAGDGPCEEDVQKRAIEKGIEDKVVLLGVRTDIPDVMQAMDVLAMPSIFEGLPVTGIEAQASGLYIVASTGVTEEMNVLNMVDYVPLSLPPNEWATHLLDTAKNERGDTYEQIKATGYDIKTTASWLQEFYLQRCNS